jgi:hypothetical protein
MFLNYIFYYFIQPMNACNCSDTKYYKQKNHEGVRSEKLIK